MLGDPAPELDPEVSDLLSDPWRLKPVPIWDVTGNGAGVASGTPSGAIKGLDEVRRDP